VGPVGEPVTQLLGIKGALKVIQVIQTILQLPPWVDGIRMRSTNRSNCGHIWGRDQGQSNVVFFCSLGWNIIIVITSVHWQIVNWFLGTEKRLPKQRFLTLINQSQDPCDIHLSAMCRMCFSMPSVFIFTVLFLSFLAWKQYYVSFALWVGPTWTHFYVDLSFACLVFVNP
jgi:hypothetical protein